MAPLTGTPLDEDDNALSKVESVGGRRVRRCWSATDVEASGDQAEGLEAPPCPHEQARAE